MSEVVQQIRITTVLARLKKSHKLNFQDVCDENKYLNVFKEKYKNWFRGDYMALHNGWWANGLESLIEEYEMIWNDEELRQWL